MLRTKTLILFIIGQLLIISCKEKITEATPKIVPEKQSIILDLTKVVAKTEKEVETVIGKAEKNEKVKGYPCKNIDCKKVYYKEGEIEIIFKKGKADRVTINKTSDLTNDKYILESLGLKNQSPAFKNIENVIRWENLNGISEISCFTDYILIIVSK